MVRLWWRNGAMIELLHSDLPTRRAPIWGLSGFSKQFLWRRFVFVLLQGEEANCSFLPLLATRTVYQAG